MELYIPEHLRRIPLIDWTMKNYIGKIKNSGQQYVKAPYAEVSKGKTKATVSNKDLRDGKR